MNYSFVSVRRVAVPMCAVLFLSIGLGCAATNKFKDQSRRSYKLSPTGAVAVHNVNGGIEITTWDREEVDLQVTKTAKTQEDLDAVTFETADETNRFEVHTKYPDAKGFARRKGSSTQVFYRLKVPKTARLEDISDVNGFVQIDGVEGRIKASTVNGAVGAENLVGEVDLSTVNGSVTARFKLLQTGDVTLGSVNGAIRVQVPREANTTLSLSSVNGRISGDALGSLGHRSRRKYDSVLGKGGAKFSASTVNGAIEVSYGPASK